MLAEYIVNIFYKTRFVVKFEMPYHTKFFSYRFHVAEI